MKYTLLLAVLLGATSLFSIETMQEMQVLDNRPITVEEAAGDVPIYSEPIYAEQASANEHVHQGNPCPKCAPANEPVLSEKEDVLINVIGQGVSPVNTTSPAQAYALAKRAAVADAYRMIAERVKGVRVEGQDLIKNMMVKRSTVRTSVRAMVKNANVTETTFRDGLCEVEMEITLSHSDFSQQ